MSRIPREYKIILITIFLIAVPSAVLCYVSIFALGREERELTMKLKSSNETALEKAVQRTHERLIREEEGILSEIDRVHAGSLTLDEAFRIVSEAGRNSGMFKSACIVDAAGVPRHPSLMPVSPPSASTPAADTAVLGDLRNRFHESMRIEFAQSSPAEAATGYEAIAEAADRMQDFGGAALAAQSLVGMARCFRKHGDSRKAVEALEAVICRYPMETGVTGMPLAPGAMMEKAWILKESGDRDGAGAALATLAAYLARNECAMPRHFSSFFSSRLLEEGGPAMEARLATLREQVKEFDSFKEAFGPLAKESMRNRGRSQRSIHLRSGERLAFFFDLSPRAEGFGTVGAALLEIDFDGISGVFQSCASDAGIEGRASLAESDLEGPPPSVAEPGRVVSKPFPKPLRGLEARLTLTATDEITTLSTMKWSLYFWIIIIASAVMVGGILFVIRGVKREVKLSRDRSDFLSNVTHDLKTPLTSIRMFIETLQMNRVKDGAEVQQCLAVMAGETDRLTRMIDRVLDFARIERGTKRYDMRRTGLAPIIERATAIFRKQLDEGDCELTVQVPENLPDVNADPDSIIEVLLNLLDNALKYSPVERKITMRAGSGDARVTVAVMDRGIGILKKDIERIFDPFFRADDGMTREVEGTGLGLAHARRVMRDHGGDVGVESEHGRGSIFTIWLPVWKE